jgi:hypothetical protein
MRVRCSGHPSLKSDVAATTVEPLNWFLRMDDIPVVPQRAPLCPTVASATVKQVDCGLGGF